MDTNDLSTMSLHELESRYKLAWAMVFGLPKQPEVGSDWVVCQSCNYKGEAKPNSLPSLLERQRLMSMYEKEVKARGESLPPLCR